MWSIFETNRTAFIDDNINLIRNDMDILVPELQSIREIDKSYAKFNIREMIDTNTFETEQMLTLVAPEQEEVFEKEFFKDKRLQVSIFMSPLNVHVTRYVISGSVAFSKYHPGKYLVAWHPKSSELNERTTVVLENENLGKILYRQIAGAIARRIVNYAKVGDRVIQGSDAGFIKFGSRVDVFLPLGTKINIQKDQIVKGGVDCIAEL